jgi:hypothetical protein
MGQGEDGLATDLAAVRVFAADPSGIVGEARSGRANPGDSPILSCVVSGLRHLPAVNGLVVRGGPADPGSSLPTGDLVEPGPLLGVADPWAIVPGPTEVLIWSTTARRLDGLVEPEEADAVAFLPATVFRLLGIVRSGSKPRVLMAELPPSWRLRPDDGRIERIRERLTAAAAMRDQPPPEPERGDDETGPYFWSGHHLTYLPGLADATSKERS